MRSNGKGLWDKSSDKLYAPDQLLPEEEYKSKNKEEFDAQMQRFGDLYEQAKKVMKLNNLAQNNTFMMM